jgi:hypothetical protein
MWAKLVEKSSALFSSVAALVTSATMATTGAWASFMALPYAGLILACALVAVVGAIAYFSYKKLSRSTEEVEVVVATATEEVAAA